MRWQVSCYRTHCFGVNACGFAYDVQVMLICEVEEENVVGLSVDGVLNCVGLVRDECCEDAKVPHASDDVVPICFA